MGTWVLGVLVGIGLLGAHEQLHKMCL
jgi:hypothetical protein